MERRSSSWISALSFVSKPRTSAEERLPTSKPRIGRIQVVFVLTSLTEVQYLSDDELAEKAKTDSDAFGKLYDRYVKRIYSYIYFRTSRTTEAEDLTERVFMQALQSLPRYEARGVPVSAWLFRIAHNLVANWHRDSARHPIAPIEALDHWEDIRANPSADAIRGETRDELRNVISHLPADRQFLLHMKFVEERSNGEIAEAMQRTEGAIKALLHRTLVSLRSDLKQTEPRIH